MISFLFTDLYFVFPSYLIFQQNATGYNTENHFVLKCFSLIKSSKFCLEQRVFYLALFKFLVNCSSIPL